MQVLTGSIHWRGVPLGFCFSYLLGEKMVKVVLRRGSLRSALQQWVRRVLGREVRVLAERLMSFEPQMTFITSRAKNATVRDAMMHACLESGVQGCPNDLWLVVGLGSEGVSPLVAVVVAAMVVVVVLVVVVSTRLMD